ncbi:MAG: OmpA family protein [Synechococcales cyanobacterium T60_A2020_003]|nr:OmpA family protein [Synechococcales cyanobacterium T60_A2020_003]
MTESATPPTLQPSSPPPSPGRGWGILVFIFRLLLLGVSGTLAFLIGMAIASLFPGTITDPPLVERAIRSGNALLNGTAFEPPPSPSPVVISSSPTLPEPPPVANPTPLPPLDLSDEERDRLQAELDQLESNLQALRDRAVSLETELGTDSVVDSAIAPLEQRVQELRQRLNPSADRASAPQGTPTPETSPSSDNLGASAPVESATPFATVSPVLQQRPGVPANGLMVTLPLDVLFATDTATLSPQTTAILDSVVSELQNYPGAAIQIAAHTDDTSSPADSRTQSFEQAKAIKTYLAQVLGDDAYHWIVVGYGQVYPVVANATPSGRQRNRRLEITISPNQ